PCADGPGMPVQQQGDDKPESQDGGNRGPCADEAACDDLDGGAEGDQRQWGKCEDQTAVCEDSWHALLGRRCRATPVFDPNDFHWKLARRRLQYALPDLWDTTVNPTARHRPV